MEPSKDITGLLVAWSKGDRSALLELMPLVYEKLRRLARRHLNNSRPDQVMQTTSLVHEAFLKLVDQKRVDYKDRTHFFAVASRAMRQILVNYALAQKAQKRGGGFHTISLSDAAELPDKRNVDILALDEALKVLANIDPRKCEIIELRFFSGLSIEETAQVLDVSAATVKRDWQLSRAWLLREMKGEVSHDA